MIHHTAVDCNIIQSNKYRVAVVLKRTCARAARSLTPRGHIRDVAF